MKVNLTMFQLDRYEGVDLSKLFDISRFDLQENQDNKDKAHSDMCEYMEAVENGEINIMNLYSDTKPEYIGVGDNVRFKNSDYQVLINYIKAIRIGRDLYQQKTLLS